MSSSNPASPIRTGRVSSDDRPSVMQTYHHTVCVLQASYGCRGSVKSVKRPWNTDTVRINVCGAPCGAYSEWRPSLNSLSESEYSELMSELLCWLVFLFFFLFYVSVYVCVHVSVCFCVSNWPENQTNYVNLWGMVACVFYLTIFFLFVCTCLSQKISRGHWVSGRKHLYLHHFSSCKNMKHVHLTWIPYIG